MNAKAIDTYPMAWPLPMGFPPRRRTNHEVPKAASTMRVKMRTT